MIEITTAAQGLPFNQALALQIIQGAFSIGGGLLAIFLMLKFMPRLMEMLIDFMGKGTYTQYNCNCERCRAKLRTKKGFKQWKKDHKFNKDELR